MNYPFKICDPVHGFIRFGEGEQRVIDSPPFQRLRYIRQMGVAYLVYPGAQHSRFEHSLGVMELVTRIFNTISKDLKDFPKKRMDYWRQILRWAALCHDMGHLPFSHTAERELLPEGGHEQMTQEFIRTEEMRAIWRAFDPEAENDIVKLAVEDAGFILNPFEKLLSQLITEDNFGADRIDYLVRDAYYTGVGYGFDFHQLIDSLRVLEGSIGVTVGGVQSVESLWIARYMMYARVYQHPKCCAYTHHMNRFMQRYYDRNLPYIDQTDFVILTRLQQAAHKGDYDAKVLLKRAPAYVRVEIEKEVDLTTFGDKVMVDTAPLKKGRREFPVLNERGKVISSQEASPFLSQIPLGGKILQVYVHPHFIEHVKAQLGCAQ